MLEGEGRTDKQGCKEGDGASNNDSSTMWDGGHGDDLQTHAPGSAWPVHSGRDKHKTSQKERVKTPAADQREARK